MQRKIIYFLFIILFFFTIPVFAKENRFYFYEGEGEEEGLILFDTNLLDSERFFNHLDMYPGKKYYDEIFVENGCSDTYSLFFKIIPLEKEEFLKEIRTKIYLNDKLVYDGDGLGEDIEVENSMFLGVFEPGEEKKLRIESMLDKKSKLIDSGEFSSEWKFYAQQGDFSPQEPPPPPIEIVEPDKNPDTFRNNTNLPIYIVGIVIAFIMIITIVIYKKIDFEEELYYE